MEITKSFYDFCVPYDNDLKKVKEIIKTCIELGYKTIAIEQKYDHTKKDASKKSIDIFPVPIDLKVFNEFQNEIKILQRLTIEYSDIGVSHSMTNSTNIKKYHLIAGLPKSEAALNHCCTSFNGDIVCFDPDDRFLVNRKAYEVAANRGMYFEIKYSPFIKYSNHRKDIIKTSHNYHSKGKSKNIIISSGATSSFDIRGPYDIANLALMLGLSEEQGKSSISSNCRKLYLKAESRRLGKTVMFIKQLGPVVFSSSDSESSEGEDEGDNDSTDKLDQNLIQTNPPHKKLRLS